MYKFETEEELEAFLAYIEEVGDWDCLKAATKVTKQDVIDYLLVKVKDKLVVKVAKRTLADWLPKIFPSISKRKTHSLTYVKFLLYAFDYSTCSSCKYLLKIKDFSKSKNNSFGITTICKKCNNKNVKTRHNKEKKKEYDIVYRQNNKEKRAENASKRRATKKDLTPPWYNNKLVQIKYKEAQVMKPILGETPHVDHIMPKDRLGLHIHWNLQILTEFENLSKHTRVTQDDMDWYLDKLDEIKLTLTKPTDIEWFDEYYERFITRNQDFDTR